MAEIMEEDKEKIKKSLL